MKKITAILFTLISCMILCTSCNNSEGGEYAEPPAEVINPDQGNESGTGNEPEPSTPTENGVLTNAVTVKIGLVDSTNYSIHMYNNAAANTMLNYLSSSELRFPTYTYNETVGFVAQSVRGNYTRNDEITIVNIKKGELYLMSGGQLRLYFKDVEGANLQATPIGYFADSTNVEKAVIKAYTENLDDYWGVDVYFLITKNPQPKNTQTRVKVTMNDEVVYATSII